MCLDFEFCRQRPDRPWARTVDPLDRTGWKRSLTILEVYADECTSPSRQRRRQ